MIEEFTDNKYVPRRTLHHALPVPVVLPHCFREQIGDEASLKHAHRVQLLYPLAILCDKGTWVKIMLNDILFIEASRNYSQLTTKEKGYVVTSALREVETKLPGKMFFRIHRSFIINIAHIDEVGEAYVAIAKKIIPLGAGMRKMLLANFQTV